MCVCVCVCVCVCWGGRDLFVCVWCDVVHVCMSCLTLHVCVCHCVCVCVIECVCVSSSVSCHIVHVCMCYHVVRVCVRCHIYDSNASTVCGVIFTDYYHTTARLLCAVYMTYVWHDSFASTATATRLLWHHSASTVCGHSVWLQRVCCNRNTLYSRRWILQYMTRCGCSRRVALIHMWHCNMTIFTVYYDTTTRLLCVVYMTRCGCSRRVAIKHYDHTQ